MALTLLDTSKTASPQCWYQSACPWFSTIPSAHQRGTQGAKYAVSQITGSSLRSEAPSAAFGWSDRRSNPLPTDLAVGIVSDDWDLLFRAVLETLGRVAFQPALSKSSEMQLQTPDEIIRDCITALGQLRRAVPAFTHQQVHMCNEPLVRESA